MSAEGLLDNPALFAPALLGEHACGEDYCPPDKLDLAVEYLDLVERHPAKMKTVIFHIRRMCKEAFQSYQLLEDCLACKTPAEVRAVVALAIMYRDSGSYQYDPDKARLAKLAAKKKKEEEGKRKRFEERMVRKAKREGLADLNFYLNQGSEAPTIEEIAELKKRPQEENFSIWKKSFSQHCYRYHFDKESCTRDRSCAFLHADPSLGESLAFG